MDLCTSFYFKQLIPQYFHTHPKLLSVFLSIYDVLLISQRRQRYKAGWARYLSLSYLLHVIILIQNKTFFFDN